ncbi:hypothetical protein J6590_056348 [Homalodisca vitripennis]|nr:hypothetical protein J6590_056348 [Homalodisca vitripennis]
MVGKTGTEGDDRWEPRYGNDSRPWLLGFSESPQPSVTTTTRETFTVDWPAKPRTEGIRRQLLRKALWEQTRREVAEELERTDAPPVTTTEYTETFIKEGFTAKPIQTDPESRKKVERGDVGAKVSLVRAEQTNSCDSRALGFLRTPEAHHEAYQSMISAVPQTVENNLSGPPGEIHHPLKEQVFSSFILLITHSKERIFPKDADFVKMLPQKTSIYFVREGQMPPWRKANVVPFRSFSYPDATFTFSHVQRKPISLIRSLNTLSRP